jgi:hypothetical protein
MWIRGLTKAWMAALILACSTRGGSPEAGCKQALAQLAVCEAADMAALDTMRSRHLEAVTVVQDVASGALVVFAASKPSSLDVSTQVMPLSLSKVFLAASWWDHQQPDFVEGANGTRVSVHEMLAGGSDSAGKQVALALRKSVGTPQVLADFGRYGFNRGGESFWAEVDPQWKKRLTPPPAYALNDSLNDVDWSSALSIGEGHMMTSALQVSRFLQGVGNRGLVCAPVARRAAKANAHARETACIAPTRMVEEATAKQLTSAMIDTVKQGSAKRIATALDGTGWSIGGKTGTGGRPEAPMDKQDGWFAGLVFDNQGNARYTVASFVRQGGLGAGNAADICAQLTRLLAESSLRK